MMTVPMDNLAAPSRELVQRLHQKNIDLENKRRKSAQARIPSDPNAWQQMRENYETIILEDHAFSEQHEIEYALWQLHYKRIEELRAHFSAALASAGSATPVGKGLSKPDRIKKIRSQFKTFLSEATGFYHDLILKIQAKYGLPLGRFSEHPHNLNAIEKDGKTEVKKGLLSCHRCLIYLGDLARYKGLYGEGDSKTREYAAASSYYMQAASLWPLSGNPHHQLAILASYSGDDLGAIYRYFRSLAVSNPFTTARDNLIIAFEKNRQNFLQLPGDSKVSAAKTVPSRKTGKGRGKGETPRPPEDSKVEASSAKESISNVPEIFKAFCIRFVRLNGILFTRTSLETFGEVFSLVIRDLHALLSSGSEEKLNFGTDAAENGLAIVRLVAILIFTVHNVNRETEGQSYAEILQRSVLLQNAFTATFEIIGHILKRSAQLHDLSSSYLLPGILVFVEWLACHPDIAVGSDMEEKQATARSFFWNHCILFLNKLMSSRSVSVAEDADETCFFNMSRYDEGETDNRLALWEDVELRGFLPLVPAQLILDFSRNHSVGSDGSSKEWRARVQRILAAGRALVNAIRINDKGVYFDQKLKKFIIGVEPPEMLNQNGMPQEDPVKAKSARVVSPKTVSLLSYMEGEEDEEEIVFKPTISEKFGDVIDPNLSTYDVGPVENYINGEMTGYRGSTTTSLSNATLRNDVEANIPRPASFVIPTQSQQPSMPGISKWIADQHDHLVNGVTNLSIAGNGFVTSGVDLQDGFGSSFPPVHSLPLSEFSNPSADCILRDNMISPETVIPSKFDSIMSSGFNADSLTLNPSAALQTNSRKNPVSRPVRHHGPPPGFTNVPPKQLDEGKVSNLKDENAPVDDYSWLDGYHMSSSTNGMTMNSINHTSPMYPLVMKDNSSLAGTIDFPFPGKQVPTMQVQNESQKSWQDYQLLEQLKIFQEQQQFQQANQQSALPPEQYQGQSLWPGRYFV